MRCGIVPMMPHRGGSWPRSRGALHVDEGGDRGLLLLLCILTATWPQGRHAKSRQVFTSQTPGPGGFDARSAVVRRTHAEIRVEVALPISAFGWWRPLDVAARHMCDVDLRIAGEDDAFICRARCMNDDVPIVRDRHPRVDSRRPVAGAGIDGADWQVDHGCRAAEAGLLERVVDVCHLRAVILEMSEVGDVESPLHGVRRLQCRRRTVPLRNDLDTLARDLHVEKSWILLESRRRPFLAG